MSASAFPSSKTDGSDPVLWLQAGALRLELAPQSGGSIAALHELRGGERFDWLRPATTEALERHDPCAMGSFPLLPWCNRIRDGRADSGGRRIRIASSHPSRPSGKHPLHGLGWVRPWRVAELSATHARLQIECEADEQWPWKFVASQSFELDPQGLRCTVELRNADTEPMPAGIGHHPYFPHRPGTRLKTATRAMWRADAEVMPTELAATPEVAQLRAGVELAQLDLDNNFVGWQHEARIEWPDAGRVLRLVAESPLDFFVLYCPRGGDHFCAEPVSQCTDAINLAGRFEPAEIGGTVLAPGSSLSGCWSLRSAEA